MATIVAPPTTLSVQNAIMDEKLRDSGIDMDINMDMTGLCGILEHAAVDEGWETNSSHDESSIDGNDITSLNEDSSLTESLLPSPSQLERDICSGDVHDSEGNGSYASLNSSTSSLDSLPEDSQPFENRHGRIRRPFSAPSGPLLEDAINRRNISYDAYYDASVHPYAHAYATTIQPAFPTVFDLFDYGDGTTFYLGGGGPRITRHLSRRQRRGGVQNNGFWPFANPPLYACRLNHPSAGQPPVVLYAGLDADRDGAWADVQFRGPSSSGLSIKAIGSFGGMTIGLPPVATRQSAWQPLAEDEVPAGRTEEVLRARLGWHKRYRFDIEVESDGPASFLAGSPCRREAFEWRYCSGAELEALDEDGAEEDEDDQERLRPQSRFSLVGEKAGKAGQFLKRSLSLRKPKTVPIQITEKKSRRSPKRSPRWQSGWQLVRLAEAADPLADAFQTAKSTTSTAPSIHSSSASTVFLDQLIADEAGRAAARRRTSDGREIVATWAVAQTKRENDELDGFSTTSAARFTFLGSGASGQLGERWALMAVASGLAVWERARRSRRRRESTVLQACGGLANIGA